MNLHFIRGDEEQNHLDTIVAIYCCNYLILEMKTLLSDQNIYHTFQPFHEGSRCEVLANYLHSPFVAHCQKIV